jgi:trans-aconitate methyltransferase
MRDGEWAPPGVDTTRPSVARVYDFMLGGKDNFAIDREVAARALAITPDGPEAGRANRTFLRRVVEFLVNEVGITQFLDIGSGLPTQGNVHEIARASNPTARVVYVDSDPMVLAHGRALLADAATATVIQADLREPDQIFGHPDVLKFLDLSQPVGLLMIAILHHLKDEEDPGGIAAKYYQRMAPGSYVAISHFCDPAERHPEISRKAHAVEKIFNETLGTGRWRTHEEILAYFDGLTVVGPGLVPLAEWRPEPGFVSDQTDTYYTMEGGLAVKM